jgi:hypothetical protein
MVNGPLAAGFLVLLAVSAVVVGSMIILALCDQVVGKNRTGVVTEMKGSEQLEPPSKPKVWTTESKTKNKPLASYRRGYPFKSTADPQPACGCQSQRVRRVS